MLLRSISPLGCGIKSISSPQVHMHHCTIFGFQATRNTDDGKQTNNGSNAKQFIACYAAAPPLSHSHTRTSGFFPRQQYYASLTTTHAVTTREGGRSTLKNKRATAFPSTHCMLCRSIYCCLSLPPITAWLADRIGGGELQKRRKVENNAGIENEQP